MSTSEGWMNSSVSFDTHNFAGRVLSWARYGRRSEFGLFTSIAIFDGALSIDRRRILLPTPVLIRMRIVPKY